MRLTHSSRDIGPESGEGQTQKWLPVIDTDACTGCGRCARACDRDCIELVWDFARLVRADECGSCGLCWEACPYDVIRMDWRPMAGDPKVGQWRQVPALPARAEPRANWLTRWFE